MGTFIVSDMNNILTKRPSKVYNAVNRCLRYKRRTRSYAEMHHLSIVKINMSKKVSSLYTVSTKKKLWR